jgi:hypothetical protein
MRGRNMVIRKDRMLLSKMSLKLNMLTAILAKNKDWFILQQIWYVPFIWALTWFSFWIYWDAAVRQIPIFQTNPINYIGFLISTTSILLRPKINAHSKDHYSFVATNKMSAKEKAASLATELKSRTQKAVPIAKTSIKKGYRLTHKIIDSTIATYHRTRTPKKAKAEPQQECTQLEKLDEAEKLTQPVRPTFQPYSEIHAPSEITHQFGQTQRSTETPEECLLCPELINCVHRQHRTQDPDTHRLAPCPLAKRR